MTATDVPSFVDGLVGEALEAGASDLHLEPCPGGLKVKRRVDGVFRESSHAFNGNVEEIANRLKVMAKLAVHRNDIPQEGLIMFEPGTGNGKVEMRLSIMPVVNGEKAVIRFFDVSGRLRPVAELGFDDKVVEGMEALLQARDGLYLVCGPSGSGKTTTIYALLAELVRRRGDRVNVVSLEDPVERIVPGVSQTRVNPDRGLDYAAGLRAIMRQDPEVIAVAEIRDRETAEAVLRASFTGHLVISTLHCGRAGEAVRRLADLGLALPMISTSLKGVLAQRLVRLYCKSCTGAGCPECGKAGFKGRTAFGEYLATGTPEMRELVSRTADPAAIGELAEREGMQFLDAAGKRVVESGLTSAHEVRAVSG